VHRPTPEPLTYTVKEVTMQANDILAYPHLSTKCKPCATCLCSLQQNKEEQPPSSALSDMEIVIGGVSMIDQHLHDVLMAALGGGLEQRKWLLRCHARQRTLAYCLGFIDQEMFDDLIIIGRIRNRFAHGYPLCSFDNEEVKTQITKLSGYLLGCIAGLDARAIFAETVFGLAAHLNEQLMLVRG